VDVSTRALGATVCFIEAWVGALHYALTHRRVRNEAWVGVRGGRRDEETKRELPRVDPDRNFTARAFPFSEPKHAEQGRCRCNVGCQSPSP